MIRNAVVMVILAMSLGFLTGCLSEAMATDGISDEDLENQQETIEEVEKHLNMDDGELMEELREMAPAERAHRIAEVQQEVMKRQQELMQGDRGADEEESDEDEALSEEERETFFDDVDGDVAVYTKFGSAAHSGLEAGQRGVAAVEEGEHIVEFCYAESGCEDRSEIEPTTYGTMNTSLIHASDPDKEVVGLKLRYKIHDESHGSGLTIVAEGEHDPEGRYDEDKFEIDDELMVTEPREPGEVFSYELGRTQ